VIGLGEIRGLVTNALKDMDLAQRYKRRREYATVTLLYSKAIEKVLAALYMSKERKDPPAGASVVYLAKKAGMPDDVITELLSLQEDEDQIIERENATGISGYEELVESKGAERKVLQLHELAARLVDYTMSYARV
jgi:HEPN domain-containing protein